MELQITSANFEEEVIKSELPVLVDFYADWCGPCKMMDPIVERVAEEYDGKLKVGKCNIDDEGDLAEKFGIMSIPTVIIFKNGEAAVSSVGALSQAGLEAKINEVL